MKNYLTYIKNHLQLSVTVFAIAALAISNTYFIARAQEGEENSAPQNQEVQGDQPGSQGLSPQQFANLDAEGSSASYPHLNCVQDLIRTTEPSDVYISDVPYSLQFHGSSATNNFQDVNGDNLPDYVYAFNTIDGGSNLVQTYMGCVYLNNGAGWDKTYQCYAVTQTNSSTGEITVAEYYGDCAGAPSSAKEE